MLVIESPEAGSEPQERDELEMTVGDAILADPVEVGYMGLPYWSVAWTRQKVKISRRSSLASRAFDLR